MRHVVSIMVVFVVVCCQSFVNFSACSPAADLAHSDSTAQRHILIYSVWQPRCLVSASGDVPAQINIRAHPRHWITINYMQYVL